MKKAKYQNLRLQILVLITFYCSICTTRTRFIKFRKKHYEANRTTYNEVVIDKKKVKKYLINLVSKYRLSVSEVPFSDSASVSLSSSRKSLLFKCNTLRIVRTSESKS